MLNYGILFITDNSTLGRVISEYLESRNIDVTVSSDSEDYAEKIRSKQPDIVVVDTETKNVSARTICKDIKQKFPHIPKIILAKSGEHAHINKYLKIPVEDFVVKPVRPSVLYLRINKIRGGGNRNGDFRNGDLVIDDSKKQLMVKSKVVILTPKEYRLIRFLMANKGQVLSRQAILNHVWGYDSYVIDRNVDVYIGYIRRKLAKVSDKKYIKTIPSFGYMLENFES